MLRAFTKNLFSQIPSQDADKGAATAVDCTPGAMHLGIAKSIGETACVNTFRGVWSAFSWFT